MAALSYWNSLPTRPYRYLNYAELFDQQCENDPEKEAFIFYDRKLRRSSLTFREAYEQSLSLAAGLLKTYPDLRPGSRVYIYTENKWEYLLSVLAAFRLGLVAALGNLDEHHGENFNKLLDDIQCVGIIARHSKLETYRLFDSLAQRRGWIFSLSDNKQGQTLSEDTLDINDLLDIGGNSKETRNDILKQQKKISPDSGAIILFSSGSTGTPKAIFYSHFQALHNFETMFLEMGLKGTDKHIHKCPFSHISGLMSGLLAPITFGASSVTVSRELAESYSYLSLMEREQCSSSVLLGFVIYDLIHDSKCTSLKFSSLEKVLMGGQILSEENALRLSMRFPNLRLCNLYGATEGLIAINATSTNLLWMEIYGNIEVKILNQNGQVVPINTPGEICVRSNTMMSGYIIDGKIHRVLDDDGWFHTNDYGMMNKSGELFIIGRMTDFIIRGPDNVPVLPLEEILDGHPKVKKSAIVPVPDPRLGFDLCACVIPAEAGMSETEVFDWCASKFGSDGNGFPLRPKLCIIMEEFPLTSTGKISKPKLKELLMGKISALNR